MLEHARVLMLFESCGDVEFVKFCCHTMMLSNVMVWYGHVKREI